MCGPLKANNTKHHEGRRSSCQPALPRHGGLRMWRKLKKQTGMIKTHVLIASRQLQSVMTEKMNQLREEPTGRLIERYNRHARTGFHVMVQAAEVACIHHLLMTRLKDSPITIESGCVVTLGPEVFWDGKRMIRLTDSPSAN